LTADEIRLEFSCSLSFGEFELLARVVRLEFDEIVQWILGLLVLPATLRAIDMRR